MWIGIFRTIWQYRTLVCSKLMDALGVLMLLWSIFVVALPEDLLNICWRVVIIALIIVISIIYAFWQLFHANRSLELEINMRTKLTVEKGDIFEVSKNEVCVIPVNEYFDTHLGDGIINPYSIHGQFISKFSDDIPKLSKDIEKQLKGVTELPMERKRILVDGLPQKRYPLGTCIRIRGKDQIFILVAVTRFNKEEHVEVTAEEYPEVIRKMLNCVENLHDGRKVYLPLIGSGISGYQLNEMQLLNTIIQASYNADKLLITRGIHICIYGDEIWNKLNLNVIKYLFERWKTLK